MADEAEAMMCSVLGPAQAGEEGERMIAPAEARGTTQVRENGEPHGTRHQANVCAHFGGSGALPGQPPCARARRLVYLSGCGDGDEPCFSQPGVVRRVGRSKLVLTRRRKQGAHEQVTEV